MPPEQVEARRQTEASHRLCRIFVTSLFAGGADPKSVQDLLGHKTLDMTMRSYANIHAQTKRQALRDQYRELEEQRARLADAGDQGDCPTCGRPLGGDLESVLGLLDRQLQEVLFNGRFYGQRVEQLATEPQELAALEQERAEAERAAEAGSGELGGLERAAREAPALQARLDATRARVAEPVHLDVPREHVVGHPRPAVAVLAAGAQAQAEHLVECHEEGPFTPWADRALRHRSEERVQQIRERAYRQGKAQPGKVVLNEPASQSGREYPE